MKFDVALKHVKVGETIGRLERTDRLYSCLVCRKVTGWRDCKDESCPGVPICSDECLDARDEYCASPS